MEIISFLILIWLIFIFDFKLELENKWKIILEYYLDPWNHMWIDSGKRYLYWSVINENGEEIYVWEGFFEENTHL